MVDVGVDTLQQTHKQVLKNTHEKLPSPTLQAETSQESNNQGLSNINKIFSSTSLEFQDKDIALAKLPINSTNKSISVQILSDAPLVLKRPIINELSFIEPYQNQDLKLQFINQGHLEQVEYMDLRAQGTRHEFQTRFNQEYSQQVIKVEFAQEPEYADLDLTQLLKQTKELVESNLASNEQDFDLEQMNLVIDPSLNQAQLEVTSLNYDLIDISNNEILIQELLETNLEQAIDDKAIDDEEYNEDSYKDIHENTHKDSHKAHRKVHYEDNKQRECLVEFEQDSNQLSKLLEDCPVINTDQSQEQLKQNQLDLQKQAALLQNDVLSTQVEEGLADISEVGITNMQASTNTNSIKQEERIVTSFNNFSNDEECSQILAHIEAEDEFVDPYEGQDSVPYVDFQGNERLVKKSQYYPDFEYDIEDLLKDSPVILEVKDLNKNFVIPQGLFKKAYVHAAKDVNFTLRRGETLSIVGESGSGKTTIAKMITGLECPTSGEVILNGEKLNDNCKFSNQRRRKEIQVVFQNPHSSLNPRKTIYKTLEEPLILNTDLNANERREIIEEIIQLVGLKVEHLKRLPHMFSGGQKQRIAIARALILKPSIVVADEAVSALDVSVQAQILNLLLDLQRRYNLSYLFISHDLSVVKMISHKILVMYHGEVVEFGTADQIFNNPQHPYTKQLLEATPRLPPCAEKIIRRRIRNKN